MFGNPEGKPDCSACPLALRCITQGRPSAEAGRIQTCVYCRRAWWVRAEDEFQLDGFVLRDQPALAAVVELPRGCPKGHPIFCCPQHFEAYLRENGLTEGVQVGVDGLVSVGAQRVPEE